MKIIIRIALGIAAGLIIGFLLMSLVGDWVGSDPSEDEWYIPLVLIGIPALGGFGAGLFCALGFEDEEDGIISWLISIFLPIGIALIAAVIALIIFGIMLLVWAIGNMTFADWALVALVIGLIGTPVYIIICIFQG